MIVVDKEKVPATLPADAKPLPRERAWVNSGRCSSQASAERSWSCQIPVARRIGVFYGLERMFAQSFSLPLLQKTR